MVVRLPFVEVIGDIETPIIRSSVLKVDNDQLMVLGSASR
jgi:hypothetical protein